MLKSLCLTLLIGSVSSQAHAQTAVDRTSPVFALSAPERKLEFAQWITGVAQALSLPVFNDEQAAQKWRVDADWYLSALQRATSAARKATQGTPVQLKARDEITAGLAGCGRILAAIYLAEGARPSGIDMWADLAPVFLSDDPETQQKYKKKAQINSIERIAADIALNQLYADFRKTYAHLYFNVCEDASTELAMPHADSGELGGVEMDLDCLRISSFPKYDSIKYTYTGTEPLRRAWIVMGFIGEGNTIIRNVQYVGVWSPGQSRWARYPRSGGAVMPKATLDGAINLAFMLLITDTRSFAVEQEYAGKERERDLARALPRLRVEVKATNSGGLRLMFHGVRDIGGVVIQAETRHQSKVRTFNWQMDGWLGTKNWWSDSRFIGSPDWKFPRPGDPTWTIPDQVVIRIWPLDSAVGVEFAPWKASVKRSGLGEPKIVRH